ncbi:MAG: 50S ribosomal protein L13 [Marinilabiliaceae bacterium]|nr:50S ribosomal protein L13 [Marinilabiliaceae bacterium]
MIKLSYRTESAKPSTIQKEWLVIDATDKILGRLGSETAKLLRGKHKPNYTPHMDCGDYVIIINAEKVKLTGNKWSDRVFFYHSGYPGGQKEVTPKMLFDKSPEKLVQRTVKGMLPKTKLGRQLFRNLYVYKGSEHKHQAQQPKVLDLNTIK